MKSSIYTGKVMHYRRGNVEHQFTYPVYYYALDLDELESLEQEISIFSYNKKNIVSIFDSDYLTEEDLSIKDKVLRYLHKYDCRDDVERVVLVTSARYFNYVFNPVSFFYCYSPSNQLLYILVEINNTFGERHIYLLNEDLIQSDSDLETRHYRMDKEFHVSPFYDMEGEYDFFFKELAENLNVKINIVKEGQPVFFSKVWGKSKNMNSKNLISTIVRFPVTASMTMPRILYQAARLSFQKKLPSYFKPKPSSPHTIVDYKPGLRYRFATSRIKEIFKDIESGCLSVEFPDKQVEVYGDPSSQLKADLKIDHYKVCWDIIARGDISIGENYTAGLWTTSDLTGLLRLLIHNRESIESKANSYGKLLQLKYLASHTLRKNNLMGAMKNISAHYDLSNKLFSLFLDPTMTYSGAIFNHKDEDLETAQLRKLDEVIAKAQIKSSDHVLEVGCGWGSFAIRAAETTGCRVTCITLSTEQADLFAARVKERGLESQIEIRLEDFRDVQGSFDKIISIEMVEAIGHKNYPAYFAMMERLLKPNGLVLLQAITYPDQGYNALKRRCDWIQEYIFPGSLIPSMNALTTAMQKNSKLVVESIDNIGDSYAETLRQWRTRFNEAREEVLSAGFDQEFIRSWNYYLAYCEAAFETRTLSNMHILLTRPVNESLKPIRLKEGLKDGN